MKTFLIIYLILLAVLLMGSVLGESYGQDAFIRATQSQPYCERHAHHGRVYARCWYTIELPLKIEDVK